MKYETLSGDERADLRSFLDEYGHEHSAFLAELLRFVASRHFTFSELLGMATELDGRQ